MIRKSDGNELLRSPQVTPRAHRAVEDYMDMHHVSRVDAVNGLLQLGRALHAWLREGTLVFYCWEGVDYPIIAMFDDSPRDVVLPDCILIPLAARALTWYREMRETDEASAFNELLQLGGALARGLSCGAVSIYERRSIGVKFGNGRPFAA